MADTKRRKKTVTVLSFGSASANVWKVIIYVGEWAPRRLIPSQLVPADIPNRQNCILRRGTTKCGQSQQVVLHVFANLVPNFETVVVVVFLRARFVTKFR